MYDENNRYDKNPDYGLLSEAGLCPVCSNDLEYDAFELEGDGGYYPCCCLSCAWTGREWYDLKFANFTDDE